MHLFMMNIFVFHEELGDSIPLRMGDGDSLNKASVSKNKMKQKPFLFL